jgi:hypothetical protein
MSAEVSVWARQGDPQPLFDGQSVPLYRQSGTWSVDESFTLAGAENSRMSIPIDRRQGEMASYCFRVRVLLGSDSSVEIVPPQPLLVRSDKKPIIASILLEGETALVVESHGNTGSALIEVDGSRQVNLRPSDSNENAGQDVQIHRQANHVLLIVNGSRLGEFLCTSNTDDRVTLNVTRGRASVADIDVVELVKDP